MYLYIYLEIYLDNLGQISNNIPILFVCLQMYLF